MTKDNILIITDEDIENIEISTKEVIDILKGSYRYKERSEISSSGYVIHTLEAALWCFNNTDSYDAAVLIAANLGHDADTMASVAGQIAGSFYGFNNINQNWIKNIEKRENLLIAFDNLIQSNN